MKKFIIFALFLITLFSFGLNNPGYAQLPFTPGSVLVLRAGDATTEGHMTLSPDGAYLLLPGYDAGPGVSSIGTTTAAENNRKLLRVDNQVNYYPILSAAAFSGTNIRSAVCHGNNYWASGSSGGTSGSNGVQYFGSGTPAQVSSTITNIRDINIFNNQLYFSSTIGTFGIYAVGTGLPVTGPQTATNVINTGTGLPNAFLFNSTNDVCYIADDRTTGLGGIQKLVFSSPARLSSAVKGISKLVRSLPCSDSFRIQQPESSPWNT